MISCLQKVWRAAIIRCHIPISSRCGQTSTEVVVDHQEVKQDLVVILAHILLTSTWSLAGGKVLLVLLILLPIAWVVLGCPRHLDPGLSEVPDHEERGEVLVAPG